uniref:C2H2-type domain-containing protein n=1 Tax=Panagrolaimus sp. JU765 TaxID=591449 RepID=A0AC34RIZ4_9BILA
MATDGSSRLANSGADPTGRVFNGQLFGFTLGNCYAAPADIQAQYRGGKQAFFDASRGVLYDGQTAYFYDPTGAAIPSGNVTSNVYPTINSANPVVSPPVHREMLGNNTAGDYMAAIPSAVVSTYAYEGTGSGALLAIPNIIGNNTSCGDTGAPPAKRGRPSLESHVICNLCKESVARKNRSEHVYSELTKIGQRQFNCPFRDCPQGFQRRPRVVDHCRRDHGMEIKEAAVIEMPAEVFNAWSDKCFG